MKQPSTRIILWPRGAPGAEGEAIADVPLIEVYVPENGNGAGVLVCPGGGYGMLALDHEGAQVARWLNERGFAAFVLHYRVAPYKHPLPLRDAQRAMRTIRSRAHEWRLNDEKIGIWGFSAGGHLAACCATQWDDGYPRSSDLIEAASCRVDFAVLAYPVITMSGEFMHGGSRDNLLGGNPSPELAERMSPEKHVSDRTPPTFLFHTADDDVVPVQNSIAFYAALQSQGILSELHVYEHGVHGVGLAQDDNILSTWPERLETWLRARVGEAA